MSRTLIYRVTPDGLSRQRWEFDKTYSFDDSIKLRLTGYGVERRAARRGRFSGALSNERWSADDERPYISGLSRPDFVPSDVLAEARESLKFRFYIGWFTPEHEITAKGQRTAS